MNLNLKIVEIKHPELKAKYTEYFWKNHFLECNSYDYQSDWNRLGPLVVELGKAGWVYDYNELIDAHRWRERYDMCHLISIDFSKVTCLAYLRHKGVDV